MTELTAITTPFGPLAAETQAALIKHGGPYEFWFDGQWFKTDVCDDEPSAVHRVKLAPPKPRGSSMTHNTREAIVAAWIAVAACYIIAMVAVSVVYHVMGWV